MSDELKYNFELTKPRFRLSPSEWADRYFLIPPNSAKAGQKWVTADAEYTREILDAVADPDVDEIYVMTSAQVFKTTIGMIIIAYLIDYDPCPMMVLYPTIDFAEKYSKLKLEPTLSNLPIIRDKIKNRVSRKSSNTIRIKTFPGGSLIIAGANSPVDLAGHSVKVLIVDDADRIPGIVGNEGDPGKLAEQRIESYKKYGYKIIYFSTPTVAGRSRIEKKIKLGDQRKFFVNCPFCGYNQTLEFFPKKDEKLNEYYGGIIWDKDTDIFGKTLRHFTNRAFYICANVDCRAKLNEIDKDEMIRGGIWKPTAVPQNPRIRSFTALNRMYSGLSTWVQLAREWVDVKENPDDVVVFYNTALAIPYKFEELDEVDDNFLMQNLENYLTEEKPYLPSEVLFLTCAVDTHPDRFEVSVEGWGMDEENWLIHYEQLWGDPDQQDVRDNLDEFLRTSSWKREDGIELIIGGYGGGYFPPDRRNYATLIDSGGIGKNTQSVYEYCRIRQRNGIIALKGDKRIGVPALMNRSKVGKNRDVILQNLGVNSIKDILWRRLARMPGGPRTCHFTSAVCDYAYFKGLLSERSFKSRDGLTLGWKKLSPTLRNEPWDLKVYNYAAMKLANVSFEDLKQTLLKRKETVEKKTKIKQQVVAGKPMKVTRVIR